MASNIPFLQRITAGLKAGKNAFSGQQKPMHKIIGKRSYAGAEWNRLTEDFLAPLTTGDAELKTRLRTLRGRARELERNEPYTRRFLSRLEDNIYDHHGIIFNSLAGEWRMNALKKLEFQVDSNDAKVIENAYMEWKKNPFVTGDMTLNEGGRLALRSTARDGDTLVKWVVDPNINKFGFALQLFEGDIIDDYRNELTRQPSGQVDVQVRMGVEVDRYFKSTAYYILKEYPGDQQWWHAEGYWSERMDASGFLHPFRRTRITQVRDTTWLCGIMRDLKMLDGYDEAAIVAARTGAAKMGFITRAYNDPGPAYEGQEINEGDKSMDAEPGLIEDLSQTPGLDFKTYDPAYPHEQYGEFVKTRLRRIGAGLDMSYYAIANDLTEVNFSSIRAGLLEDREHFKALQTWWIDKFEAPVFLKWLEIGLLNGTIKDPYTGKALPFTKLAKFKNHKFRPRRWSWVDPQKDVAASVEAINNRIKSRTSVVEETSQETFEDIMQEQAMEQKLADQAGVILPDPNPNFPSPRPGEDKASTKKTKEEDK
jgi:lambda family phage portal protein